MPRTRILILGAAGKDFHVFNTLYRDDDSVEVVGFTAQQIPHIDDRIYPASIAGELYPDGITIYPEDKLDELIVDLKVDRCVMAYSDVSHEYVGHLAARVTSLGAGFELPSETRTMYTSNKPVVAVCASRTGVGKSQTSRAVARVLREAGLKVAAIRHPMPYGDLAKQRVQRFAEEADMVKHEVTIEEREEYEPHIASGSVVFAGVDYGAILEEAEKECDVILWDGGNNDTPFYKPDVHITLVDPHRPGHELSYYPGETNVRMSDVIIINKVATALPENVQKVRENVLSVNPDAMILDAASPIFVDDPTVLKGKKVLVIEDGPTLTHGGMKYGAGTIAARRAGASELIDPRPFLVGELKDTFESYPGLGVLLPAMGYGDQQVKDLEATIAKAVEGGVEAVAVGTPIDLVRLVKIPVPNTRVRYELQVIGQPTLEDALAPILKKG